MTDRTESDIIEHLAWGWVSLVGEIHLNRTTACLGSVAHEEWSKGYNLLDSAQRYRLECRVVEILNGLDRMRRAVDGPVRNTEEDRPA